MRLIHRVAPSASPRPAAPLRGRCGAAVGPDLEPARSIGSSFGAEDFSYFSERMPSVQLFVGSGQPGRDDRVHNSDYQPDEACIAQSAIALTRMAVEFLS